MAKKILILALLFACLLQPSPAFAHGGHGGRHGWGYGGWGWGGCGWGWGAAGLVETAALMSAYPYAPYYYVNGVPYYYGNPYYSAAPIGYVGVAQPPVAYVPISAPTAVTYAAAPAASSQPATPSVSVNDSVDIHIPNGNGSFTLVTLQKTEKGFMGPQGEFYADHPTEDQLRARYCRK